jgi:hypothetical protein
MVEPNHHNTVDLIELLSACIDLAERAGDVVREIAKSGDLQTKEKGILSHE